MPYDNRTDRIKDEDTRDLIKNLQEESQQGTISLGEVPTADKPILSNNQQGIHDDTNQLFIRKGNKIYSIPISAFDVT